MFHAPSPPYNFGQELYPEYVLIRGIWGGWGGGEIRKHDKSNDFFKRVKKIYAIINHVIILPNFLQFFLP